MAINNLELWNRIDAWDFTPSGSNICFERSLALENGWTQGFATLVTTEYRKFLYLTQTTGQLVCPSDEVDQAWHLHLTQTLSYQQFCEEVLGDFLHHHASKGGPDELERHKQMYSLTLDAYEQAFGGKPHREIWPDVENRFKAKQTKEGAHIVEKNPLLDNAFVGITLACATGFISAKTGIGETFWKDINSTNLLFIFAIALAAIVLSQIRLRGIGKNALKDSTLDPYEVAYLVGGKGRQIGTASAQLIEMGAVTLIPEKDAKDQSIKGAIGLKTANFDVSRLKKSHYVERTFYDVLSDGSTKFESLSLSLDGQHTMRWFEEETLLRLSRAGLAIAHNQFTARKAVGAYLTIALSAVAINRIFFGLAHQHSVAFLVLFVLACFVTLAIVIHKDAGLTERGVQVMSQLQNDFKPLKTEATAASNSTQPSVYPLGSMVALGFALFGTQAVMASTDFAGINFMFDESQKNNTGNSNSSGGCGGGGCGGGGCGGCGG